MKDFKKFSIEVIIIAAAFFAADFVLGSVMDKTCAFGDFSSSIKKMPQAEYDMIILGGSRAHSSYNVPVMEDSLGITIYDYGIGGTNLYVDYGLLDYYLSTDKKKPKMILWDIWATSFTKSLNYGIQPIQILNSAYLQNDTIKSLIDLQGPKERVLMNGLHLYKHNSKLLDYAYALLKKYERISTNGFIPLHNQWNAPIKEEIADRGDFDEQKIEYFKRFVNRCKQEGIYLVFCISPSYYKIKNTNPEGKDWAEFACDYINNNGFLALNYEQDSLFLEHPEWFYNPLHVNEIGADIFTQEVMPYLRAAISDSYGE